jgi:glycosyltransferase involved in cell wall biosynthesis
MHVFSWIIGILLAAIWVHRLVDTALGMPRLTDISTPEWDTRAATRVSIVVPARNEAQHLEPALRSLLALDYPDYQIIAVNDRSTDATGEVMRRIAVESNGRLRMIDVTDLPSGWMGKTHAMWRAAQEASGDWILFTDADVSFRQDALRRAVAYAEAKQADHVVLFPTHVLKSFGERMMIGFFQALFIFGHRPWKVADPKTKDHMGIGAFNLVRRSVYEAVGTYQALRLQVIDDMKLGEIIKLRGYRQRNVFGRDLLRLWWAKGAMGVVDNLSKNFFALLHFSRKRAIGATVLLLFLNFVPFLGLVLAHGWARVPFAVAVTVIALIYLGQSWYSDLSPWYFIMHPVSTFLFAYILLRSMFLTLHHGGVMWRGTLYPLDELKSGMAIE